MLFEFPEDEKDSCIKELAAALKSISTMFSLQVLLKGNVLIREIFGNAIYKDVIGQDALIKIMTTNEPDEKKVEDRKHFLLEDGMSHVHIALNSDISGINNLLRW